MKRTLFFIVVSIGLAAALLASCAQPLSGAPDPDPHVFAQSALQAMDISGPAFRQSMLQTAAQTDIEPAEVPLAALGALAAPQPTPSRTPKPTPVSTQKPSPGPLRYTMEWAKRYAPGSVAPFEEQVGDNGDYEEVTSRPAPDTYQLVVDYHNQCVRAYKKTDIGSYELERLMICTTGGNGNWTPTGMYHIQEDYHRFGFFTNFNCYAQYWTQMQGSFYFHSLLYNARDASTYTMSSYNQLGRPGSHGCIRLFACDARWLYENCAPGTLCTVTTEFPEDPQLKAVLRKGLEGCVDYVEPAAETEPAA